MPKEIEEFHLLKRRVDLLMDDEPKGRGVGSGRASMLVYEEFGVDYAPEEIVAIWNLRKRPRGGHGDRGGDRDGNGDGDRGWLGDGWN